MSSLPNRIEDNVDGELREFGNWAHELRGQLIGLGGTILPDESDPFYHVRASRGKHHGQGKGTKEARSAAGSRARRRTPTSGAGAAPQAVWTGLDRALRMDEVFAHYPGTRWANTSSSTHRYCAVPVRQLRTLQYRATVVLELPNEIPKWLPLAAERAELAPEVRTWAYWSDGVLARCFHGYPDKSACTHSPGDWRLLGGRGIDLVSFAVLWLGKTIFLRQTGFWPGLQHYPAEQRLRRDPLEEFCGCGKTARYDQCCRGEDHQLDSSVTKKVAFHTELAYRNEIARRGWAGGPPFRWGTT